MNLVYGISRHEFPVALLVQHPIGNGEGLRFESHLFSLVEHPTVVRQVMGSNPHPCPQSSQWRSVEVFNVAYAPDSSS